VADHQFLAWEARPGGGQLCGVGGSGRRERAGGAHALRRGPPLRRRGWERARSGRPSRRALGAETACRASAGPGALAAALWARRGFRAVMPHVEHKCCKLNAWIGRAEHRARPPVPAARRRIACRRDRKADDRLDCCRRHRLRPGKRVGMCGAGASAAQLRRQVLVCRRLPRRADFIVSRSALWRRQLLLHGRAAWASQRPRFGTRRVEAHAHALVRGSAF